jgi:4-nitrophenyl phosphatase
MGIEAYPSEVVTSGMAAASYLVREGLTELFVIGEPGLVEVLREKGLQVANASEDGQVEPLEGRAFDALVCGICRIFSYRLLSAGLQAIRADTRFVATNPDATYPMEGGRLEPGAGSLVAALRTCSGVEPYVAGKPSPEMVELALKSCGAAAKDALVIGDRTDTDLVAGVAAGCPTVLVLTGVTDSAPAGVPAINDLRGLLR